MMKLNEETVKEFVNHDFIQEIVAGMEYGREFRFLKRASVNGSNLVAVYKIELRDGRERFEFFGYIKDQIIWTDSYFYEESENVKSVDIFFKEKIKEIKELIEKQSEKIFSLDKSYTLTESRKRQLDKEFRTGRVACTEDEIKEEILRELDDKDFIRDRLPSSMKILTVKIDEISQIAEETVGYLGTMYNVITAENNYLRTLEEKGIDKTSTLCRLFNELYKEGKRNVNAVFDFGYTEVEVKLNLPSDATRLSYHYAFFGGTQKSHDAFEKKYYQPISMTRREIIEFLPFIKEIKVGKKTIYEDEINLEYIKENQLMNLIFNSSRESHNDKILQIVNKNPLNAAILDEHRIIYNALYSFYISLEVFEALKGIGCNIYAKEVQELLERNRTYSYGLTRDLSEIKEKYYAA